MTPLFVTREIDVLFSRNCSESLELKPPFPPQFCALDFAVIIFGHIKNIMIVKNKVKNALKKLKIYTSSSSQS